MYKMETIGVPLRMWDVQSNLGIKTGCNDAFIIDDVTRETLVAEDPNSAEILKPVLRGRDIQRYQAQWAGLWLIDTHNGYTDIPAVNINDYPAVKSHLDGFYPRLEKRQDKGRTPYNLRNCAYHEDFSKEKLMWMNLSDRGRFAYFEVEMYCNNAGFVMTGYPLKYLCAILNSTLITWLIKNTARTTGMGLTGWEKFIVEAIPIPNISAVEQRPFIQLVDCILAAKDADPDVDTTEQEREIDHLVYTLYGLTEEEIAAIEGKS